MIGDSGSYSSNDSDFLVNKLIEITGTGKFEIRNIPKP